MWLLLRQFENDGRFRSYCFSKCNCILIIILLLFKQIDSFLIKNGFLQDLETYLISVGATNLLERKKQCLTEKSRRELIRHVFEYQTSRFGKDPNDDQKKAIDKAVVFLFPSLKSNGKKGDTVS